MIRKEIKNIFGFNEFIKFLLLKTCQDVKKNFLYGLHISFDG